MSLFSHLGKPPLLSAGLRVFLICAVPYLLACVGCGLFQRRLLYFPSVFASEQVDTLASGEKLERWRGSDGQAIGWKRLYAIQPVLGQVIILHGNAGCAFHRSHYADAVQQVAAFDVYVVEYPGYGDRPGIPSEKALNEAALEALASLPTNRPTYLVGESLGNGVAAYLAGRCPQQVAGLALLAPFNRLTDVAQAHMPIFPVRLMLADRFPAEDNLRSFHGPLAVLVAGQDTVVPQRFGRRLYDGYVGPKRLWEFPQSDHETVMVQPPELWKEIVAFWQHPSAQAKSSMP